MIPEYTDKVSEYLANRNSPEALLAGLDYNLARYFGDFRSMNAAQRPIPSASTSHYSASSSNDYADDYAEPATAVQTSFQSVEQPTETESSATTSATIPLAAAPKRQLHTGIRRAIAFESSVKLTVNLLLSIVAATTIAKLIPYYQNQQQRLSTLQESVIIAEEKNAELRSQFSRNFDPAQAQHIMQEQSGMAYPNQKKVIWTVPLDTQE